MTERLQVYKCEVCGNIVEVLHAGQGELVCCGQPMALQVENTVDAAVEKHVPVVEVTDDGVLVKVGEVAHPMTEEHYIEWVQVVVGDMSYRIFLKPGIASRGQGHRAQGGNHRPRILQPPRAVEIRLSR
jgi:superoxide reductase